MLHKIFMYLFTHQQIGHTNKLHYLPVVHGSIEMLCSFIIITDELTRDKFTVWTFLKSVVSSLKAAFPTMEKLKTFSDGSAAQIKNKFTL